MVAPKKLQKALDQSFSSLLEFDDLTGVHATRVWLKKVKAILRVLGDADVSSAALALRQAKCASDQIAELRDHQVLTRLKEDLQIEQVEISKVDRGRVLARVHHAIVPLKRSLRKLSPQFKRKKDLEDLLRLALRDRNEKWQKAFRLSRKSRAPDDFHALRRRTKDLLYAFELLKVYPRGKANLIHQRLKKVSDLTGDAHDLWVLREHIPARADRARKIRRKLKRKTRRLNRKALVVASPYFRMSRD